ncbi:phosphoadenosine phosphosulfate reductase domain-containing protein [Ferrimonas marina]|uniref:Phosphoadenosine phosphosulfate reductase family protein n=1 Tax=Ferrimonas marina TaxID=299255 RepID=A0A1M5U5B2_9GAMM|nr:phosphoadenosine phosphosulfate reductase family protein [Ferrimonas marina]SHH58275.1 Phosphoadenosine phosphosulfate reductase family protein [Ferrimonas marina]
MDSNTARTDAMDDRIITGLGNQLDLFQGDIIAQAPATPNVYFEAEDIELDYDLFIVCMSGKDSFACLFRLLEMGVPTSKIECWHHLVDGRETPGYFADWPHIESFLEKVCESMGIPLYYSWLMHGFKGEMLKKDSIPHPHKIQTPTGTLTLDRSRSKPNTRMMFPQQSADIRTRYCSGALKIDPARRAFTSQDRFIGQRVLFITGERRQESPGRSKYNQLEPHFNDTARGKNPRTPRFIDHWRPVLHFSEQQVWDILAKHKLIAPLPYRLGFGRSSCMACIFNHDRIWATIGHYWPERMQAIAEYEKQFGVSIHRNGKTVVERAAGVKPIDNLPPELVAQAVATDYTLPLFLDQGQDWELPLGAFSELSSGAV